MKYRWILFGLLFLVMNSSPGLSAETSATSDLPIEDITPSLDSILRGIESRYSGAGFAARFTQKSTIKAMQITDTASGKVLVKRPGMMRWEYETPDKQAIITDGSTLWVYRPDDNQVMIGKAPSYFKGGKGANFLSDIKLIRQDFTVMLEKNDPQFWTLKLTPNEKKFDVSVIRLAVSKKTNDLVHVITTNSYEDETVIEMSGFEYNKSIPDDEFRFAIPKGIDVLKLEE